MSYETTAVDAASVLAITRLELLVAAPEVPADVPDDAHLVRDLGVDLATLRVFADRLEYRFGMSVPDADLPLLRTLDQVAESIVATRRAS
jgi:acyl carrier protein